MATDTLKNANTKVNEANNVLDEVNNIFNSAKGGKTTDQTAAENALNQLRVRAKDQLSVLQNNAAQLEAFLQANGQASYGNYLSNTVAAWRLFKLYPTTIKGGNALSYETKNAAFTVIAWMLAEPSFGGENGLLTMSLYTAAQPPTPGASSNNADPSNPANNGAGFEMPTWGWGLLFLLGIGGAVAWKMKGKKTASLGEVIDEVVSTATQMAGLGKAAKKQTMTFKF